MPKKNTPLEGYTAEDIALLKGKIAELKEQNRRLGIACAEGHRQAAVFAAAAGKLTKLVGEKLLGEVDFYMPDTGYVSKVYELAKEQNK